MIPSFDAFSRHGNPAANGSRPIWLEFTRRAMACQFDVLLHPERPPEGPEAAVAALEIIASLEQLLSVYIPTSDLCRVNHRAHELPVDVSLPTVQMIQLALEIHALTEGAFDITAASLSQAWGFSSRQGRMPDAQEIEQALARVGSQHIRVDAQQQQVRLDRPVALNPGGIGKGYALDCAADLLLERGVEEFAIHGGKSSIRAHGRQLLSQSQPGWNIAVRHPEQSERALGTLVLKNQSLGTSGPANQFFYFRGTRYGHIIDPRSGWPAQGALSLSVLHASAAWADALATGLYVLGIERTIEFCQQHPEVGVLAILPSSKQGGIEVVTCNLDEDTWQPHRASDGISSP
ncbi:MAG: FAD:protein FMN transferase [Pirellula sp.]